MRKMYLHELRSTYKGLIAWIVGVLVFQLSGYSKFEGFQEAQSSNSLNAITGAFPRPLAALFGMVDLNIASLVGYYGILYIFFALMAVIHAGLTGAGIISKEERDKTSEFLLTRPASRSTILSAKLLAGLTNVLILFAIIAVTSVIAVALVNKGDYSLTPQIMNMMWGMLLMQLVFFTLGALLAGVFKKPKLPTLGITVVVVGSYIVYAGSQISDNTQWLRFTTPFRWFAAASIIDAGGLGYGYVGLALALSLLFAVLCYVFYNHRDITVA